MLSGVAGSLQMTVATCSSNSSSIQTCRCSSRSERIAAMSPATSQRCISTSALGCSRLQLQHQRSRWHSTAQRRRHPVVEAVQTGRMRSDDAAPALVDQPAPGLSTTSRGRLPGQLPPTPQGADASLLKILYKRILRRLSSLPLAIGEMFVIAGLSAVGTVIEQNKPIQFYIDNYPDADAKVLGFLTYDIIFKLHLDQIYTAPYFLGLMALLAASLAACTSTRQFPAAKVARRWRFAGTPQRVHSQGNAQVLPAARVADLANLLAARGFQVFVRDGALYGFKGLAGRLGPIGVHASMLAIMGGVAWGGLSGWKGSAMAPQGSTFLLADAVRPASPLARLPDGGAAVVRVDKFSIDYREDGSERQFYSDLTVLDGTTGQPLSTQHISVNKPLRWGGLTAYQTDWSVSTLILRAKGSPLADPSGAPISLAMASLEGRPGVSGRLWGTFLPAEEPTSDTEAPRGVSILARDMQSVAIYDARGQFVGIRRPDSGRPIEVEGMELVIEDMVGATGLELKSDPGVPFVYAGFAGMMVTTLVSYLSHSQVWALQEGASLHVGSRTNRATFQFGRDMEAVLDDMPERPPQAPATSDAAASG